MKKLSNEEFEEILSYQDMISPAAQNTLQEDMEESGGVPDVMEERKFIEFLDALNYTGFVERFDYVDWANKRNDMDPTAPDLAVKQVDHADLDELRKLMTMHIRIERFAQGHMQELYESGFFDRFFEQVRKMR